MASLHKYRRLQDISLLGNLAINQYQLENGLLVAIVVDTTTPIFTYQTWFNVGSADEPAGRQGLAHLFEHMMFRKTATRGMGEFERIVNNSGGTGINAYTSRDQTVYFFTFPNDKVELAADLESDRMANLVVDDEMFETEKGAVLTEKNRGLDDPNRLLWETVYCFGVYRTQLPVLDNRRDRLDRKFYGRRRPKHSIPTIILRITRSSSSLATSILKLSFERLTRSTEC